MTWYDAPEGMKQLALLLKSLLDNPGNAPKTPESSLPTAAPNVNAQGSQKDPAAASNIELSTVVRLFSLSEYAARKETLNQLFGTYGMVEHVTVAELE
jgi:hypothetical protein